MNCQEYLERTMQYIGNRFDADMYAKRVWAATVGKKLKTLYFGFDPNTYRGEIVVLTDEGYIFVPLEEMLELAGGVWSDCVFLRLLVAQERLSAFLAELGKKLKIEVVDRLLYASYLLGPLEDALCKEKQNAFREQHREQLAERETFSGWCDYHNQGFAYRYIPSTAIQRAINGIYDQREILEENGCWQEARTVIQRLRMIREEL